MLSSDLKQIKELYASYGFQFEESGEGYVVFSLIESIFPGVDILADRIEISEKIKSKYSEEGYSTNVIVYDGISSLDINLYKRVLNPALAKRNLLSKYQNYISKILDPYKNKKDSKNEDKPNDLKYQYIEVGYLWEQQFIQKIATKSLIDTILDVTSADQSHLIIIEAPAGFGKTSTSFELLKRLCQLNDDKRPFMMELERERQATTFRYLLVSQIDRQFGANRKSDLIIENIKKGRIPLIIDGFDELLSKDLDSGKEKISFKKVETMLSTIASLLEDKAKVILTTRKTAIFSGNQFVEWVDFQQIKHGRGFMVDRFQLMEPTPADWLDSKKLNLLPNTLSKISNPTILSFLKYTSNWQETKNINAAQLVEKYLNTLFIREKDRQQIEIRASSQEKIMSDIAAYFCIFDITADLRSNIKNFIYESNSSIIDQFAEDPENRQELLNKLVNHALLDRHESGLIGFVNDFVYGTLLYKALISKSEILDDLEQISTSNAEKIIEASEILDFSERVAVASSLIQCSGLSDEVRFKIDYRLLNSIKGEHSGLYLNEVSFSEIDFNSSGSIKNTTFIRCRFDDCNFNLDNFENCYFISCDFSKTKFFGVNVSNVFYECNGILFYKEYQDDSSESNEQTQDQDLDIQILKMFKRTGSESTRIRHVSGIISELESNFERKTIMKHLSKLKSKEYIYVNGDNAWLLQSGSEYLRIVDCKVKIKPNYERIE